jgi:diguanylate cyclase (GGDEF)-like protein
MPCFNPALMNTLLSTLDTTTGLGLNFQAWVPVLCLCLFAVLGLYAMLLMFGGQYFSKWRRFLLPSTLAARIALGISIAASLPIISLILIGAYGAAGAWLIGAVIIAAWLAIAFSRGIIIPLRALDQSVRDFDLNAIQESVAPPIDAPHEVIALSNHLGSLDKRVRAAFRKLSKALRQGEKLRAELIYVIAEREKEIEERTEELKQANDTLKKLCKEDHLTGLANRRWFAEFLSQAWQSALREQQALSILMIDIDDFKAYNDHCGHKKGDACLKIVAETVRRMVGRASDQVSRYGGEEFVVVLGNTPLEGALTIAESIRVAVQNLGILHKGAENHETMTVSVGVTSTQPTREARPETLLVSADRAMYNAKHNGKNQVAYSTTARTGIYQALCLPSNMENRMS